MKTFYSLTIRQFLAITKVNKFLYGNTKEKKVYSSIFFAAVLTVIILSFYWFRTVFHICVTLSIFPGNFRLSIKTFSYGKCAYDFSISTYERERNYIFGQEY